MTHVPMALHRSHSTHKCSLLGRVGSNHRYFRRILVNSQAHYHSATPEQRTLLYFYNHRSQCPIFIVDISYCCPGSSGLPTVDSAWASIDNRIFQLAHPSSAPPISPCGFDLLYSGWSGQSRSALYHFTSTRPYWFVTNPSICLFSLHHQSKTSWFRCQLLFLKNFIFFSVFEVL